MNDKKSFEVSVIVFRDEPSPEDAWTALALEMSVRGYGPTPDKAVEDLIELLQAQVSFAIHQGHPESVWHPAEPAYWQMFEEARRSHFLAEASGTETPLDVIADMVPLSLVALKSRDEWTARSDGGAGTEALSVSVS